MTALITVWLFFWFVFSAIFLYWFIVGASEKHRIDLVILSILVLALWPFILFSLLFVKVKVDEDQAGS